MSYPLEHQKGTHILSPEYNYMPLTSFVVLQGRYIAIFWAIWSMGAVIGSIIPTADNWHGNTSGTVKDGTYIALFILMICGSIFSMFLLKPSRVVRDDGSKVFLSKSTSIIQELKNLPAVIRKEPFIILFFPYSFCGLWYIPYQSNDYNAVFFNIRTRVCAWSFIFSFTGS